MKNWMTWIQARLGELNEGLGRMGGQGFMEAVAAGCALVASADGTIRESEREKFRRFIRGSDLLAPFSPDTVLAAFDRYTDRLAADYVIGEAEALRAVGGVRGNPDTARLLVRVCCAICAADGELADDEIDALQRICRELSLDFTEVVDSEASLLERSGRRVVREGAPGADESSQAEAEPAGADVPAGFILAPAGDGAEDRTIHELRDAGTGEVLSRWIDVAVGSAFSVMVNTPSGENRLNLNAGPTPDSARIYDGDNRDIGSIAPSGAPDGRLIVSDAADAEVLTATPTADDPPRWRIQDGDRTVGTIQAVDLDAASGPGYLLTLDEPAGDPADHASAWLLSVLYVIARQ